MAGHGPELFISDLHLSKEAPQTAALFFAFLEGQARSAGHLTILGDLFDAWAGDDDLTDPFNARIVAALRATRQAGVALSFMAGNRDFLIGADFAAATGGELLPDPCLREITGARTLLTHGDTLCTDDADYQRFRAAVRTPQWRADFLARPLAGRKAEIEALRRRSEAEKRMKPMALMDVNPAAVASALSESGAQAMIHGHTHRRGQHVLALGARDCRRWALGDWQAECGNALLCDETGWRWLEA